MKPDRAEARSGFALVIVLWGLVLIGLVITQLTAGGRFQTRIAGNEAGAATAAAAADGGIHEAVFYLTQADRRLRWEPDGQVHRLSIGRADVTIRVFDISGLINPNLAPPPLLAALLRGVGVPSGQAATLAAAIVCWRDPSAAARPGAVGGEADYRAAGKDYGPPGAPMENLEEMGRILGMTPAILAAIRPHLSLRAPSDYPSPMAADPVVARALAEASRTTETASARTPGVRGNPTVRIIASAVVAGGSRFVRDAVVRVSPSLQNGFQILDWDQRTD